MMERSREVIATHACENPSNLDQDRTKGAVALGRFAAPTFARTQMTARAKSHP